MNRNTTDGFKLIGYLHGQDMSYIKWDKLTHINYAFAIPTAEGTIIKLKDEDFIEALVDTAHENRVRIGLSVGGWSYQDETLESTFVKATDTDGKCQRLSEDILKIVDDYGFDGVDMDWEYPRAGESEHQYESFMTYLRQGLTNRGKFLTAAVIGEGDVGKGQTDYILDMLDWINVMSYDDQGDMGHSTYDYAVKCGEYWIKQRKVDPARLVLGVPFYARPSYVDYKQISEKFPDATEKDLIEWEGVLCNYNGLPTMEAKTRWACENAGGIMIWELSQDSREEELSLLNRIDQTIHKYHSDFKRS